MFIERVDQLDAFRSLKPAWDALYLQDPEAQFFLSWRWLASALEAHPGQWLVLAARDEAGRYRGFLPLRLKTVWSKSRGCARTELEFAGRLFWADYGGVICAPDDDVRVMQAFAEQLRQMSWSRLSLKGFRVSDRRYAAFIEPLLEDERLSVGAETSTINDGATDNLICPYLDLPPRFETYLSETLSSNTRQKVRRFLRRIESSSDFRVTVTTRETLDLDIAVLERLWLGLWGEVKRERGAPLAAKYGEIVKRGLEDGLVHMPVLWHGDQPVGVLASYIDDVKSTLLFFVSGRDDSFREIPVGLVLHAWSIRWAIDRGIHTYDFLRGDEPYKVSLGAQARVQLKYPVVRSRSGRNLLGWLDPGSVAGAVRMTVDLARRDRADDALTALYQALSTIAGHETAAQLLDALAGDESREVASSSSS